MLKKRTRLHLEQLEDRLVPSVTAQFANGSLYLSGSTTGELDITHTGALPSTFTVMDNGHAVGAGTYNITSSLYITLSNRRGDIKIDLNTGRIAGSVVIDLGSGFIGAGPSSVDLYDSTGADLGSIGGSVTVVHGNGQETLNVGAVRTGVVVTPDPITIRGNLTNTATVHNGVVGNALNVNAGTTIFGTVTATQIDNVTIGSATTFSALTNVITDVSINDFGSLRRLQVALFAAIGRNLSVTGTALDDSFALQTNGTVGSGVVNGTANVNLGQGQANGDQILLASGTVVGGNTSLAAGDNLNTTTGDQFRVLGSVNGNLTVSMGNGTNSLYFSPQNVNDQTPFVGGSMTVTGGSGTNNIGIAVAGPLNATGPFAGTVVKNLTITLGSGPNGSATQPMTITASVGGTLTWTSGNNMNFLQLGDNMSSMNTYNYVVNIQFGNDDDTIIIDLGPTGNLSGPINGGGRVIANTFVYVSGNLLTPSLITNFP